jgi:hypothetical protein
MVDDLEMRRVDTEAIAAEVINNESFWDRAALELDRETVGIDRSRPSPASAENAVSLTRRGPSPEPTRIGRADLELLAKPLLKRASHRSAPIAASRAPWRIIRASRSTSSSVQDCPLTALGCR